MTARTLTPRALLLLGVLTLIWGTNWPLFPIAMREISVWTFRACSMTGAGLMLLVIARARGQLLDVPRRHWGTLLASSFCYLVVWNIASAYSTLLIPSGQTAVLGFTMPLWAALMAWGVLGQRPDGRQIAALVLGGLAVCLLMWPALDSYAKAPLGFALGIFAGLGWAVGTLILQRRPIGVPALVLTGWQLLLAGVPVSVGALLLGDHEWFVPGWQTLAVVAYITVVPMSLGNLCWFAIVGMLPANIAGVATILVPIVAMVSGAIVHGEPLGVLEFAAMACCAGALSLMVFRQRRQPARHAASAEQ